MQIFSEVNFSYSIANRRYLPGRIWNAPLRITTSLLAGRMLPAASRGRAYFSAVSRSYVFTISGSFSLMTAGKIVQRVFLGDSAKRQSLGAESLCFQPSALVHLMVAVLDVAQYRMARYARCARIWWVRPVISPMRQSANGPACRMTVTSVMICL